MTQRLPETCQCHSAVSSLVKCSPAGGCTVLSSLRPVFVPASGIYCVSKLNLFFGTVKVGTNYRLEIFFGVESFTLHEENKESGDGGEEDLMRRQD